MRIVSWNMRKNKKAWDYFFESINPDIELLQESGPLNDDYQFNVINKNVKKNLNNSILFKTKEPKELPIEDKQKMGLISSRYQTENDRYSFQFINIRLILILFYLKQSSNLLKEMRQNFNAKDILISGDFNMDRRMDENPTKSKFSKKGETRHNNFFDGKKGSWIP